MAQSVITIRTNTEDKKQFESLCKSFGMNINTAVNLFIKQVNNKRQIPFTIEATKDETIMSKEQFYTMLNESREQIKRGEYYTTQKDETLDNLLDRFELENV